MNALVTIQIKLLNMCSQANLDDCSMTFEEMVKWLITEEGGFVGFMEEEYTIVAVEENGST